MMDMYILSLSILTVAGAISSLFLTRFLASFFKMRGFVGIDVFKPNKPEVPLLGGLSIPVILVIFVVLGHLTGLMPFRVSAALSMSILIITIIGLIDDFYTVPGLYKPVASILGGIPLILLNTYTPHLNFPMGVGFRISIIYILMILLGISIASNTVNMLDVINGTATSGAIIVLVTMFFSVYILDRKTGIYPIVLGIAVLLGFLYYNMYPSRVFLGNAPALVIGGYIGALAIIYNVEFPTIVAMFPYIHNSFFFLNKIRGFVEHKQLNLRVTKLNKDGVIYDARDKRAPITLLRFIVSRNPMTEYEAYINIVMLFVFSGILAIISSFLMR